MANRGSLTLTLRDVEGQPIEDEDVTVRFWVDKSRRDPIRGVSFVPPTSTRRFGGLPAFPQGRVLRGRVSPSRYRTRNIGFFTLIDGEDHPVTLKLLRRADEWSASFGSWSSLSGRFASLKRVLKQSADLKVHGGRRFPLFTKGAYDAVLDKKTDYAKASLLNVYYKMSRLEDPTVAGRRWFTYVDRVLELRRARFIGVVRPEMGEAIRTIKADIGAFPHYENTGAKNHHGNLPHHQYRVLKSSMVSIKSSEAFGNLQLTLAPATEMATGQPALLLDADIDEKGRLFEHLLEVFEHKLTGKKTHPFDIREILAAADPGLDLGYELV